MRKVDVCLNNVRGMLETKGIYLSETTFPNEVYAIVSLYSETAVDFASAFETANYAINEGHAELIQVFDEPLIFSAGNGFRCDLTITVDPSLHGSIFHNDEENDNESLNAELEYYEQLLDEPIEGDIVRYEVDTQQHGLDSKFPFKVDSVHDAFIILEQEGKKIIVSRLGVSSIKKFNKNDILN